MLAVRSGHLQSSHLRSKVRAGSAIWVACQIKSRDEQKRAPVLRPIARQHVDWPMICSLTAHALADPAPRLAMTAIPMISHNIT